MLSHKKLLIDQHCPMCKIYGKCFVKLKFLDRQAISPYQTIGKQYTRHINMNRARNEIAFYDYETMKTLYGLDAMIEIVSQGKAGVHRFLHSKLIYGILLMLYRFISYNRKVIYPSKPLLGDRVCEPDVNLKYRTAYIIFSILFTGLVLNQFVQVISLHFGYEHIWYIEYLVALGQIPWQLAVVMMLKKKAKVWDYLGNMVTVSNIGALLLVPIILFYQYFLVSPFLIIAWFMLVVVFMFVEHIRRCHLIDLPWMMSFSWVLYRVLVLLLIIILGLS